MIKLIAILNEIKVNSNKFTVQQLFELYNNILEKIENLDSNVAPHDTKEFQKIRRYQWDLGRRTEVHSVWVDDLNKSDLLKYYQFLKNMENEIR